MKAECQACRINIIELAEVDNDLRSAGVVYVYTIGKPANAPPVSDGQAPCAFEYTGFFPVEILDLTDSPLPNRSVRGRVGDSSEDVNRRRLLRRLRPDLPKSVIPNDFNQSTEVGLQDCVVRSALERVFVHVQRSVDLDLQAVPPDIGATMPADNLHALIWVINPHAIAETLKRSADNCNEFAAARRAVPITQYEIGVAES